jgi:hypothetical protein
MERPVKSDKHGLTYASYVWRRRANVRAALIGIAATHGMILEIFTGVIQRMNDPKNKAQAFLEGMPGLSGVILENYGYYYETPQNTFGCLWEP